MGQTHQVILKDKKFGLEVEFQNNVSKCVLGTVFWSNTAKWD